HVARHALRRREALPALLVGSKKRPEDAADIKAAGRRRGTGLAFRGRGFRLLLSKDLVGGFAVDGLVIGEADRTGGDDLRALGRRDGADARGWRTDEGARDHAGHALRLQRRDQRLTDGELGYDVHRLEG